MGLIKFIKSQTLDVIEWTDPTQETMVYKYPMNGKEIMMGAKLTVRESQLVIFVNEGQIADVFEPGLHKLSTSNLPILTKLKSWKYDFNSPFKSDVYFVNTKQFTNQKWGTANPVMMRDRDFGIIRVRAYGIYSFRITDPVRFMKEAFGTNDLYTVKGIGDHLRKTIVSGLSDAIAESNIPALDMASQYDELGELVRQKMVSRFGEFGLDIPTFVIENISLPEEVEKAMDTRSSMGALGDLNKFTQYQTAYAIRDAAQNEGGIAGFGVGAGAGIGLGQAMAGAMAQQQYQQPYAPQQQPYAPQQQPYAPQQQPYAPQPPSQQQQPATAPAASPSAVCVSCKQPIAEGSKFCPECGAAQVRRCPNGHDVGTAKFCPECGSKVE